MRFIALIFWIAGLAAPGLAEAQDSAAGADPGPRVPGPWILEYPGPPWSFAPVALCPEADAALDGEDVDAILSTNEACLDKPDLDPASREQILWRLLGLYLSLMDAPRAFQVIERLEALDAAHAINLNYRRLERSRAVALYYDDQLLAAIEHVESYLAVDDSDYVMLSMVGDVHAELRNLAQAEAWYDRAIELEPYDLRTRIQRATLFLDSGRFAEGIPDALFVTEHAPHSAHAANMLYFAQHLAQPSQADASCARAAELDPELARQYFDRARREAVAGNTRNVRLLLGLVERLDPNFEGLEAARDALNEARDR